MADDLSSSTFGARQGRGSRSAMGQALYMGEVGGERPRALSCAIIGLMLEPGDIAMEGLDVE